VLPCRSVLGLVLQLHGLVHGLIHCEAILKQIGQTFSAGLEGLVFFDDGI
jgi:hypothetical protein